MAWKSRSLQGECTRRGPCFGRAPGFIRLAAAACVLLIAAVVSAAIYLLRDPAAPLDFGSFSEAVRPAQGTEPPPNAGAKSADARKVDAILDSVDGMLQSGKSAEAEAIVKGAVEQYPSDQRLHIAFAELMLGKNDLAAAYESYLRALASGDRDAKLEFQAGTVASMLGKSDRALEHYAAAQTADATNAEYPLYLGQIQLQLGKLDEARASLVRAGHINPDDGRVWGSLAEIALRENKLDVALQQIEKARAIQPRLTLWRFVEARIHARAGRPEKSVELLIGLDAAERASEPVARVLADALSALRRDAEAADVLAQASDKSPDNANLAFDAALRARKVAADERFSRLRERAAKLGHVGAAELN
ncbi:MAG: tetratricopeptide repeat protein [Planctomycetes bacterium]|nr:tetratricopeptide repeat protein [Planctomycetota bacterium]